ncbi:S-adenosyl-L-methionine-dependent methyltransferase [Atractiella rhizophila]|nr:S-adenosyl-L-methionine-dependent methyltransferase [Atractiella rhizophila]
MELLPDSNVSYSTREYWDERYSKESSDATYDWFKSYADIKSVFESLLPSKPKADMKVLMLGCGNSRLSEEMYLDGYTNIDNIDFSEIVIENMKQRYSNQEWKGMRWIIADIRDLPFEKKSYDVVVDKGTMDALLCYKGDIWNPPQDVVENVEKEMAEVRRVLKDDGVFIYVSFAQPHFRKRYLLPPRPEEAERWVLDVKTIGDSFHYFIYRLKQSPSG